MRKLTADERIVLQEAARIKRRVKGGRLSESSLPRSGNPFWAKVLQAIKVPSGEEDITMLKNMLHEASTMEEYEVAAEIVRILQELDEAQMAAYSYAEHY